MNNPPADTAGGEEEPVHEDPSAVVVRVVGQQPVPLVLLLTGTVSITASRGPTATDLLVDGLLELLVIQDRPHLPVAVAGPVRSDDLNGCAANVLSGDDQSLFTSRPSLTQPSSYFPLVLLMFASPGKSAWRLVLFVKVCSSRLNIFSWLKVLTTLKEVFTVFWGSQIILLIGASFSTG